MISDYSITKIDSFKQCRCKYKLQYIDKIKVDRTKSIETFIKGKLRNWKSSVGTSFFYGSVN